MFDTPEPHSYRGLDLLVVAIDLISSLAEADGKRPLVSYEQQRKFNPRCRWT